MKPSQKTNVEDEYVSGHSLGDEEEGESCEDNDDETERDEQIYLGEIKKRKRYLPPQTASSKSELYSFMERSGTQEKKGKTEVASGKGSRGKR